MPHPENMILNHQLSTHEPHSTSNSVNPPTLLDYILVLAKNWKMIVGMPFIVAIITAIITMFMPNIYNAKAMILPGDDDSGNMMGAMMAQMGGLASLAGGLVGGSTKADLYVTMLKSETIKDPIIDRFKLMEVYKARFRQNVYKTLDESVAIGTGKKDGVITIAVDDIDPKRAAEMANAYIDELARFSAGLNMSGAGSNRVFLEKRITEARADLTKAEDDLKIFQSKNKSVSVTDQAKATIEGVSQLRAQLATQEVQLAALQRQFTDSSQEVKNLKTTITNLKSQISRLEGTSNGMSSSIPSIGSVPQLSQEYMRLMREFKIQEAVLEMLTKQYEVSKLSEVKDLSSFKILQKAKIPERKSGPKRSKVVILTFIATGLFMIFLAFALEFRKQMNSVDNQRWDEIKKALPVLPNFIKHSKQH